MTGATVINDISVVERCPHKRIGSEMAERTILSSWQVIIGKASADHTIMAGCAIAAYIVVIKYTGGKNTRGMTGTAIVSGWHMIGRLTGRVNTVMAGSAQLISDTWHCVIESF